MIKFSDLLKELKYGKVLFGDPNDDNLNSASVFKKLLKQYSINQEPNTKDETQFLEALTLYFSDYIYKKIDVGVLKELLKLKSKFPKFLDPKESIYTSAYRGTVMNIKDILKQPIRYFNHNEYIIENPKQEIQSKGDTGYLSFSGTYLQAEKFSKINVKNIDKLLQNNSFPVIMEIDMNNPKLLFNTEFTNAISVFQEDEVLLIDNKYKPKSIMIKNPNIIFSSIKYMKKKAPDYYELRRRLKELE